MRTCNRCGVEKSLEDFPRNHKSKAGRLSICAECRRKQQREWAEQNRDKRAAYDRAYREKYSDRRAETQRRWREKNREKDRAQDAVEQALKRGELVRPEACSECDGQGQLEGHHEDYTKQLEVEWLCRRCHARRHRLVAIGGDADG